jgi:hypothetical protein
MSVRKEDASVVYQPHQRQEGSSITSGPAISRLMIAIPGL